MIHRIVVNRKVIRPLFDPEVNRDAAAYIGDPNRKFENKQTVIRYFNNGLCLLDQLCRERHYTKETTSGIQQMEGEMSLNETPALQVDLTYEQRLAKVSFKFCCFIQRILLNSTQIMKIVRLSMLEN